jgi:hypothetical protein
MRTRGVNTAVVKPPLTAPTASASRHYDFALQIRCILLAQKFHATRFVQLLALEVRQEWLRVSLPPKYFTLATKSRGALDQFLIDWIIEIEHETVEENAMARQAVSVKGVE